MNTVPAIAALALAATATANAQSFTTVFGPSTPVGDAIPDAAALNGLDAFTTFAADNRDIDLLGGTPNAGEVLLFQIGSFYVGGAGPATSNPLSARGFDNLGGNVANNRAYGVLGEGRSDIVFDAGVVESLTLQVRGTELGGTTGSSPNNSFGGVQDLADANATLLVYTHLGLQATIDGIDNSAFQTVSLDVGSLAGDSITRISLINQGPFNSAIVLGELTVGVVPTPGAAATLAMGGLLAARRRR